MNPRAKVLLYGLGAIASLFICPYTLIFVFISQLDLPWGLPFTITCIVVTGVPFVYCLYKMFQAGKALSQEQAKAAKDNANHAENQEDQIPSPTGSILSLFVGIGIIYWLVNMMMQGTKLSVEGIAILVASGISVIISVYRLIVRLKEYRDKNK